MELKDALEFIVGCNKEDFENIRQVVSDRVQLLKVSIKSSFRVGDEVKINHRKTMGMKFKIIKINNKNIKVQDLNSTAIYNASPNLLSKI